MSWIFSRYVEKETFFQRVMKFLKKYPFSLSLSVWLCVINICYFMNVNFIETFVNNLSWNWIYFLLLLPIIIMWRIIFVNEWYESWKLKLLGGLAMGVNIALIVIVYNHQHIFIAILPYGFINIIFLIGLFLWIKAYSDTWIINSSDNILETYAFRIMIAYLVAVIVLY